MLAKHTEGPLTFCNPNMKIIHCCNLKGWMFRSIVSNKIASLEMFMFTLIKPIDLTPQARGRGKLARKRHVARKEAKRQRDLEEKELRQKGNKKEAKEIADQNYKVKIN